MRCCLTVVSMCPTNPVLIVGWPTAAFNFMSEGSMSVAPSHEPLPVQPEAAPAAALPHPGGQTAAQIVGGESAGASAEGASVQAGFQQRGRGSGR